MVENNENIGKKEATSNNDRGDKPQSLDKIERAELAVKRMEEAERRLDEKISKLTELETNRLLGATAGRHIEGKSIEQMRQDKIKEQADEIVKSFKK